MNIEELMEQAMVDGELDKEALSKALSENYITKEEATKQVNGASKRIKAKYESKKNDAVTPEQTKEVERDQTQQVNIQEEVSKAMGDYFTKQETEKEIAKKLEVVKPEFRDYVKHEMTTKEDFDLDGFLKDNDQFKDKVTTRTENVSANNSGQKAVSEEDKKILAMIDQM